MKKGVIKLWCADCCQESSNISANGEIMLASEIDLQHVIKQKGVYLEEYFINIGRFLKKHSGHRILVKNESGQILFQGNWQ